MIIVKGSKLFRNYFIIAWRNFLKYKSYSFINLTGLAVGLACAIFVLLMLNREYSVNRSFAKVDRIYRVSSKWKKADMGLRVTTLAPVGPLMSDNFPEVVNVNRSWPGRVVVNIGGRSFREDFAIVERSFFEMFDFPFIEGLPSKALDSPHSVVITEGLANKYFGSTDVLGKVVTFQLWSGEGTRDYQITGVTESLPRNSVTYFDDEKEGLFISDLNLEDFWDRSAFESWQSRYILTFVELKNDVEVAGLEANLAALLDQHCPEALRPDIELELEPLSAIHLTDNNGRVMKSIRAQILFVILIILIACINFVNLATARSFHRAREVGLRKVLGSSSGQLIRQFLSEAIILSILALLLALGLVEFILGVFDHPIAREITLDFSTNGATILLIAFLTLMTGLLAGSYPAFFLSSFQPVDVLKGGMRAGRSTRYLRSALVVVQFVVAIFFFISANVVSRQQAFMSNRDLGFNRDNVLVINSVPREFDIAGLRRQDASRNQLLALPDVVAASLSWDIPGAPGGGGLELSSNYLPQGQTVTVQSLTVDESFPQVFDLDIAEGRFFSKAYFETDTTNAIVINESAAGLLGLSDPLNQEVVSNNGTAFRVIGILKDFSIYPNARVDQPLAFIYVHGNPLYRYFALKIRSNDILKSVEMIESSWRALYPDVPFEYEFLDQIIQSRFAEMAASKEMREYATALASFVACLGLLGLASFSAQNRSKEIGIRKVLGATVFNVIRLLTREFAFLIVISITIASPIAYFIMKDWLSDYVYHIDLGVMTFVLAGTGALLAAILTVSVQAIRAAIRNPVDVIRYE